MLPSTMSGVKISQFTAGAWYPATWPDEFGLVFVLSYDPAHGAWRSLVSALVWGTRGPEFESRRPDKPQRPFLPARDLGDEQFVGFEFEPQAAEGFARQ